MADKLLRVKEVALVTGLSVSTVFKLARAGKIRMTRLGSAWVIPQSKLYADLGLQLPDDKEKEYARAR